MARTSMLLFATVIAVTLDFKEIAAKTFERCDLARELARQGFQRNQLQNWVCLIEAESDRRTHMIGRCNRNGSRDYGLFAISDMLWCNSGHVPGKACNAKCSDLRDDDITDASECAKLIFKKLGFDAWYGWQEKCKGKLLPDLMECS